MECSRYHRLTCQLRVTLEMPLELPQRYWLSTALQRQLLALAKLECAKMEKRAARLQERPTSNC